MPYVQASFESKKKFLIDSAVRFFKKKEREKKNKEQ